MTTMAGVVYCYVKLLERVEKGERSWEVKLYTRGRLREVASRVKLPETLQLVYTYLHLSSSTPTYLIPRHPSYSQGHSRSVW